MNDIFVLVEENEEGMLAESSKEALSEAQRLAKQKAIYVHALVMGEKSSDFLNEVWTYSPATIYALQHELLNNYQIEAYVAALTYVIKEYRPCLMLMAATPNSKDFAPRLAAHLELSLVTDCVKFQWGKHNKLHMSRFQYNKKSFITYTANVEGTQLATILPNYFAKDNNLANSENMNIVELPLHLDDLICRTKMLEKIEAKASSVDLSEATMIVAGGRGAKNKEGFQIIYELAEILGASVGASRVATDEGWIEFERQIGQTGKVVSPQLYIACGISGAIHHTMGIKDAKVIITINRDKSAPIVELSDLSLIGDMHEVLPLLIEKIKQYKKEKADVILDKRSPVLHEK